MSDLLGTSYGVICSWVFWHIWSSEIVHMTYNGKLRYCRQVALCFALCFFNLLNDFCMTNWWLIMRVCIKHHHWGKASCYYFRNLSRSKHFINALAFFHYKDNLLRLMNKQFSSVAVFDRFLNQIVWPMGVARHVWIYASPTDVSSCHWLLIILGIIHIPLKHRTVEGDLHQTLMLFV